MRNQALKFNSGSINENEFLETDLNFKSIMRNRGPNWTNWESNGQLRVKSRRSETRDQNKKKARAFKVAVEILEGYNCMKLKI